MKRLLTICAVVTFVLAVSATAQADLVAHWMFDETSGITASDSSGNSNDGTLSNMAGDEWLEGALYFDGDNDYVKVLAPPFPTITNHITIAMWVNADVIEDGKILLWKSANYGLAVGYAGVSGDLGTFGFTIRSGDTWDIGAWQTVSSTTTPVAGEWYHIAGTFDGTALRIYLNGVLESTLPYSGSFYSDPWSDFPDVYVGGHPWPGEDLTFEGLIDDVRIFDHALTLEEIAALASRACIAPPEDLVSWWPGDGNEDDIVGGNNGTLEGGAAFVSPGKVGDAFTFTGRTGADYVRVPNDPSLEPTTVTVDAWVRAGSPGNNSYIVTKGVDTCRAASYALYTSGGGLTFYVFDGGDVVRSPNAGTGIWDNQWHHVAGTFDGSSVRLYVDGAEVGSGTPTSISIGYNLPTHNDLIIGGVLSTCSVPLAFQGDIDEVEIFDRALTQSEIQAIYNAGSAGKCKEEPCFRTIGYWKNHSWEGAAFFINSELIGKDNGILILSAAKSKNFSMLFAQLIAAKLNCSVDACNADIIDLIAEAEAFLFMSSVDPSTFNREFEDKMDKGYAVERSEALDEFNNSIPCDDDE